MKLLVFSFRHTIAEQVAYTLELPSDTYCLDSSIEAVEDFITKTDFSQYTHLLGLGAYSGRDQEKIRIETICTSQFRNHKKNLKTSVIPYFLQPNEHMKLSKGMGNSWCNLVSYRIVLRYPEKPFTFLHVPRKLDTSRSKHGIEAQLCSYIKFKNG